MLNPFGKILPKITDMWVIVSPLVSFWNIALRPISYFGESLTCQVRPKVYLMVKILPGPGSEIEYPGFKVIGSRPKP
jgi:hypothetical protein